MRRLRDCRDNGEDVETFPVGNKSALAGTGPAGASSLTRAMFLNPLAPTLGGIKRFDASICAMQHT
jgi:hypothetical protein